MKKALITLAIAVMGITVGYGQTSAQKDKATPVQKAEKSTEKLQKELSLTADQKKKVYAIELDRYNKTANLHKSGRESKSVLKDQQKAIKKDTEAKLDQVLNAEQKKKLDVIQAEKKAKKDKKKANKA
jgi:protein CpxP